MIAMMTSPEADLYLHKGDDHDRWILVYSNTAKCRSLGRLEPVKGCNPLIGVLSAYRIQGVKSIHVEVTYTQKFMGLTIIEDNRVVHAFYDTYISGNNNGRVINLTSEEFQFTFCNA